MPPDLATAVAASTVDSAMDAIITVDDAQRIVLFNAAAESMFGWSRAEAIGAPLATLIPTRFHGSHATAIGRFGGEASPRRRMAQDRIVTGRRRSGEEFPIDASISHLTHDGRRYFTVILRDVTLRLRAIDDLTRSRAETKALAAAAQDALEHEKRRIARELHDELGQSLTMLTMDVAWCKTHIPSVDAAVAAHFARMEELLKATVAATRRIASDLRPLMLDDLGLAPALEWLVQTMGQRSGIACTLAMDEAALDLPQMHSTALFRVVQEALTNIAKHARATQAAVEIVRDADRLRVVVRDNGVGFDAGGPRKPASFGLLGLRERVSLLQGDVGIDSTAQGTSITIDLPVPRDAEATIAAATGDGDRSAAREERA